jgi:hypothetical protein
MNRAWRAAAAYLAIALVATWPLARGLGRDVAWDLGDSILNIWAIAWDCEQLLAIVRGDVGRIATFFDANIFYPERLTLAYSDHLIAQAIQIFPVYAVSRNPILCYNLLFLSTFVLSALGMYLLVRELTGDWRAAFVAGLLYGFAPYRLPQSSHLQVLSSQWMPFVLYGLTRHFDTGRLRPLAGASIALVAQNLSSGYYLLFFAPLVVVYAAWEGWRRGAWRDRRTWTRLVLAGSAVAAVTAPFLLPYAALREDIARSISEISRYSADVYSFATAFPQQRVWGRLMQAFPKAEGELFPGAVPVLLALIGVLAWRTAANQGTPAQADVPSGREDRRAVRVAVAALVVLATSQVVAVFVVLLARRATIDLWLFSIRMSDGTEPLVRATFAFALALVLSPRLRSRTARFMKSRGVFAVALFVTAWLALGPRPEALGRPIDIAAPYEWLLAYVPGFTGLRVPARFAMIVALLLAILGGYGAAVLARRRGGRVALWVLAAAFLVEATHVPFTVNGMTATTRFNLPEARLYRPARAPVVYQNIAPLNPDAVLVELPLGYPDFDLRAMYYSLAHRRPVVNGYSGFVPLGYARTVTATSELPRHPELSLEALRARGATHAIVHESAFPGSEGPDTTAALIRLGGAELFREGPDVLVSLPR